MAIENTKWPPGVRSGHLALTKVFLVFPFFITTPSMMLMINK